MSQLSGSSAGLGGGIGIFGIAAHSTRLRHVLGSWRPFFETVLDRFADLGRTWRVPVVVFQHTALEYLNPFHPYRDVYARIAETAEGRGMQTIQSLDVLRGHDEVSLWVSAIDATSERGGTPRAGGGPRRRSRRRTQGSTLGVIAC